MHIYARAGLPAIPPISMASALKVEEALGGVVQQGSFFRALCTSSGPLVSPTMIVATARKDDTQSTSITVRNTSHCVSSLA